MAVAIWDHLPTAAELLDLRLAAGWRPTPSLLVGGPRVLGHAASVDPERWSRPGSTCPG